MNVTEALKILQAHRALSEQSAFALACGFTPLHLSTLLAAHLQLLHADRRVVVETGTYGDLPGNLESILKQSVHGAAVVFEWADFDPRLGLRDLGGWRPADVPNIIANATQRAEQYLTLLRRVSQRVPVALCLPTLPLPPAAHTAGWQSGELSIALAQLTADVGGQLCGMRGVRIVAPQHLDLHSPLAGRLDVKAYLATGFPYRVGHASAVAEDLARLLRPAMPKKGLVTDLDNTLWRGILGEDGVGGISWDLDHKSHIHGLYQQLLQSLADGGALIAVASKTEPALVQEALRSRDLLLRTDCVFPIEAHWEPKSISLRRIVNAWNIGADSVVFVDDSELELAEVKAAFPDVECVLFPTNDEDAAYALLQRLRDLFGKETVSEEDALRLDSIRAAAALPQDVQENGQRQDGFLAQADQELTVTILKTPADPRALELINKTNQFNLNGRRLTEGAWASFLARDDALALLVAYRDKYGPLGKICVLAGRILGRALHVDAWVLSCRAFTRRIEYACLDFLFQRYPLDEIVFNYEATPKNKLVCEFLTTLTASEPNGTVRLTRQMFVDKLPQLSFTYDEHE